MGSRKVSIQLDADEAALLASALILLHTRNADTELMASMTVSEQMERVGYNGVFDLAARLTRASGKASGRMN